MPPPSMYHFTHVVSATRAVTHGLTAQVTPSDPLQAAGVWLSPNVYGFGTEGSFFGPIGLRVASAHLTGCACLYVGPNPRHPSRHRFLLLPNGVGLPRGVQQQNAPKGLASATTSCELLLLGDVPAAQIDGVLFGDEQGISGQASQLEHARFLGYLLAEHRCLVGANPHPHSTEAAPYGGWSTFRRLRQSPARRGPWQQGSHDYGDAGRSSPHGDARPRRACGAQRSDRPKRQGVGHQGIRDCVSDLGGQRSRSRG